MIPQRSWLGRILVRWQDRLLVSSIGARRPKWDRHKTPTGVVHVVPRRDVIPHELTGECACGPTLSGGYYTPTAQHHALDGRTEP